MLLNEDKVLTRILVNEIEVSALIDTGADCTIIDIDWAADNKIFAKNAKLQKIEGTYFNERV